MIHRCPKTRAEDGLTQPVTLSDPVIGNAGDGVCLDGKRLFDRGARPDGTGHRYQPELADFSDITLSADGSMFTVVTKSGETRYYGMDDKARVRVAGIDNPPPDGKTTAIWLLQKVVDVWGNYYEIHYNDDKKDFTTAGIVVSQINYTGRLAGSAADGEAAAVPTFQSIKFGYQPRPDVRQGRFRSATVPRNQRLSTIDTGIGVYTLDYGTPATNPTVDDKMLPSLLRSIKYCPATGACAQPLAFDWDAGGYSWVEAPHFKLPDTLTPGTWFMDLDGDGRLDMVSSLPGSASYTWRNTGASFERTPQLWTLTSQVWSYNSGDSSPGNTAFADLDGDGLLDALHINTGCGQGADESCKLPGMYVWLNRIRTQGKWVEIWPAVNGGFPAWVVQTVLNGGGALADMDGDGLADLVWMPSGSNATMKVLINKGLGTEPRSNWLDWYDASAKYGGITPISDYELRDVNRDGLPDLVGKKHTEAAGKTYVNTGKPLSGNTTVWVPFDVGLPAYVPTWMEATADFDGDGLYDVIQFGCLVRADEHDPATLKQLLACPFGFEWYPSIPTTETIALSTGLGYDSVPASDPRMAVLKGFTPPSTATNSFRMEDFAFIPVDINGDGLADLVQRRMGVPSGLTSTNGGVLFNTGSTFVALDGATSYKDPFGSAPTPVPFVPKGGRINGNPNATFIDLDGDGVTDLANRNTAYLNTFRPPVIKGFPNGLAKKTVPTYQVITTAEARNDTARPGHPTYKDSASAGAALATGTSFAITPLRVVASLVTDDGVGGTSTTDYEYRDLRASPSGRGPQGFSTVIVTGPVDSSFSGGKGTRLQTTTQYLQSFPYTGMPWTVSRHLVDSSTRNPLALISLTTTGYCDAMPGTAATCTDQMKGDDPSATTGTTRFVRPATVFDESFLLSSTTLANGGQGAGSTPPVHVNSELTYDKQGNPTTTTVTTADGEEKYEKKIVNVYGAADSVEERLGKVTWSTVTTQRTYPQDCLATPITHTTAFEYGQVNQFASPVSNGVMVGTLGLRKSIVEPGIGAPVELHTAYEYDRFGNVVKTTSCASAFDSCGDSGATGTSDLPYRITQVSYDPADFKVPIGSGLFGSLTYGAGRYPVRTTNAAGQTEYTAYDARFGTLLQQTGPNGISTCKGYDGLGRQTSEIARCGSSGQLLTMIQRLSPTRSHRPAQGRDGHDATHGKPHLDIFGRIGAD